MWRADDYHDVNDQHNVNNFNNQHNNNYDHPCSNHHYNDNDNNNSGGMRRNVSLHVGRCDVALQFRNRQFLHWRRMRLFRAACIAG